MSQWQCKRTLNRVGCSAVRSQVCPKFRFVSHIQWLDRGPEDTLVRHQTSKAQQKNDLNKFFFITNKIMDQFHMLKKLPFTFILLVLLSPTNDSLSNYVNYMINALLLSKNHFTLFMSLSCLVFIFILSSCHLQMKNKKFYNSFNWKSC